jgi:hypothetical protein
MPVTINGSTGISSPGGDTSTSLSTGLLTVTGSTVPANGVYLPGTNILGFATNSSERVRIDASGNVAIGASAASSGLVVVKAYSVDTDGATSKWTARFQDSSSYGTGKGGSLLFTGIKSSVGSTGNYAGIAGLKENATDNNEQGYLAFYTTPSTGIITERARIDSSGKLLVGTTSAKAQLTLNAGITFNPYITAQYTGFNVVEYLTYNNNSANAFSTFCANAAGNIIISSTAGVTVIPFWPNGGTGITYVFTMLDPDAGTFSKTNSVSFVQAGTSGNTFTVTISAGAGIATVQRTAGSLSYNMALQLFVTNQ